MFSLPGTNENTEPKPALTLSIGSETLPKILGWLVVAKQWALWEGGSFGGLHLANPLHLPLPWKLHCEYINEEKVTDNIEFVLRDENGAEEISF